MEYLKSFKAFESVTRKVFDDRIEYYNDEGQKHREDGPAIEYVNGGKQWWLDGKLHRENGPAVEYFDGDKYWYLNGKNHREDGPAIEYANGAKEWFFKGERHREDGPAVEYANGGKEWFFKGERHREDGPAIEYANGDKSWYLNGKFHREDGPAIVYVDGGKAWCLNGSQISDHLFIKDLTNQQPNPNLFIDLPIEDLEELSADLCDKYDGGIKQWCNFYAIYFKEKLDPNDPDLKSFENRIKDFRIGRLVRVGLKSILVY